MTALAPRRALLDAGAALATRHPHARALQALLWEGALVVETPASAAPGRIDLRTLVQIDGDVVTAIGPEALAPPAEARATLDRHGRALASCREALESELAAVAASMGHFWMAGTFAYALATGHAAPLPALLVFACGPAFRFGWRRARATLVRRTIRRFAARLAARD